MTVEDLLANPRRLPRCFECGAVTCWRGEGRSFVGCSHFPKCRWWISIAELERMLAKRRVTAAAKVARLAAARARADRRASRDGA